MPSSYKKLISKKNEILINFSSSRNPKLFCVNSIPINPEFLKSLSNTSTPESGLVKRSGFNGVSNSYQPSITRPHKHIVFFLNDIVSKTQMQGHKLQARFRMPIILKIEPNETARVKLIAQPVV